MTLNRLLGIATAAALCTGCLLENEASADSAKPEKSVVKNVEAAEAAELLKSENAPAALDVRTPREYANGHIAGATNIDFSKGNFEVLAAKLDPKKPYLLYCWSGGRSSSSLATLRKLGFEKIYHLHRGMLDWEIAGFPDEQ